MEGIGYWIFLLLLYLLAGILKKRRRDEARRKLEQEDSTSEDASGFDTDFLKSLFGAERLQVQEGPLLEHEAEIEQEEGIEEISAPVYESEFQQLREEPVEIFHEQAEQAEITVKPQLADVEHKAGILKSTYAQKPQATDARIQYRKMIKAYFARPADLKQAILLKEILDKPRALRKPIR